jgi:tripartite-type tricarboxylate transporter receptor subunit TctC
MRLVAPRSYSTKIAIGSLKTRLGVTNATARIHRRSRRGGVAGGGASAATDRLSDAARRIIVGFGPGGFSDITARIIVQWLSERLGQPFVIDNRPGAGSTLAAEALAKAPPDGYVLGMTGATDAINAILYKPRFDYRDIIPIASIARTPGVMERSTWRPLGS